ncbi:hypothetical protein IFM89_006744 [Coptis chinensis]|uniref:RNA helicase n=1 Tax=Coptis chinensis TaxID=261450 RepID=A0A835LTM6_9MAGN|nr:hypothetical protein IFM89_006744 [Coptis chinensis]
MLILNQPSIRLMVIRNSSFLHYCKLSTTTTTTSSLQKNPLFYLKPYKPSRSIRRNYAANVLSVKEITSSSSSSDNGESFYADESVTWNSIGVSEKLSRSLSNIGLHKPSLIQATCIPSILSEKDVVVAAETGSGKTHGYLVPLFDKMLNFRGHSAGTDDGREHSQPLHFSLVLCPNVMLCEQVVRMANCINNDSGQPLLQVSAVCGRQGWPVSQPDILVSTPAALLNYLYALDPERRRRSDFLRGLKYVVFDEADMLLCGSFQNQVIRLINMFRFEEKVLSRLKNSVVKSSIESNAPTLEQLEAEFDDELQSDLPSDEDDNHDEDESDNEDVEGVVRLEDPKGNEPKPNRHKDWIRARKIYERSKQYIFVAATLPLNGKKTAGGVLKRMFPDANWASGSYLHCHNPRLEQRWIEVTIDTQVDVLIDAVEQGLRSKELNPEIGVCRTLVFANTVDAVEAVAKILRNVGVECSCYHSDSSLEERSKNLVDFRERGGVLVCTDAAARGLDVLNVQHVIQRCGDACGKLGEQKDVDNDLDRESERLRQTADYTYGENGILEEDNERRCGDNELDDEDRLILACDYDEIGRASRGEWRTANVMPMGRALGIVNEKQEDAAFQLLQGINQRVENELGTWDKD